ncbi:hypothetical protein GCM10010112_89560 [Actinoplanes lobatus]|uniref:Uncharacterized protein n=1 Tax=Actinoplanes lobatus TaxID=113568 RepID=A0ABQ4AXC6_9ACTN|nr:hypothetical protein GCM10010112_89560 [Actinoplanes lobatus]GIE45663.1 hypothetical protein Alo02nite_85610 [Actinoplanes lobatus]
MLSSSAMRKVIRQFAIADNEPVTTHQGRAAGSAGAGSGLQVGGLGQALLGDRAQGAEGRDGSMSAAAADDG